MIVYVITSPAGKKYVGISKDAGARFIDHGKQRIKRRRAINAAFAKYGKENMRLEILEANLSLSAAQCKEQFWIKELGTLAPDGYNLTTGGEIGKTHCEEVRRKISAAKKGIPMPADLRQRISQSLRGRVLSDEHRAKLSQAGLGKKKTEEHRKNSAAARKGKGLGPRVFSAEHRANIKAAWQRRMAREAEVMHLNYQGRK